MMTVDTRRGAQVRRTLAVALALAAAIGAGCKGKEEPLIVPVDHPTQSTPATPDESVPAATLARAIELARPKIEDGAPTASEGVEMLVTWSERHLGWGDIDLKTPETTIARADADPPGERGKRLCESGTITEMKSQDLRGGKVAMGILTRNNVDLFQFVAVRSTGTLAEKSPARFCGVFTARVEHAISTGGTAPLIQVVGMFDLPENRKAPPEHLDPPHPANGKASTTAKPATTTR